MLARLVHSLGRERLFSFVKEADAHRIQSIELDSRREYGKNGGKKLLTVDTNGKIINCNPNDFVRQMKGFGIVCVK